MPAEEARPVRAGTGAFDTIMTTMSSPMVVVTTVMGDERAGCLVGFHAQASIEPAHYSVWLSKANHTYRVAIRASHLAIHFLTSHDRDLARVFGSESGDDLDKFDLCDTEPGPHGVPLLSRCANRLVARRVALLDAGGDHVCVLAEPIDVRASASFTPLRLADVRDLDAGHPAEDRDDPPTERAG
jgi:flavin reductase (DIM6/NTAB) family NADH-FMN oxidoreductase RutF